MTRVLIVDDAKFMRDKIREILETEDLQVAGEAENGEEAVLLYQELQPDLVIMDITMPVKNGIEALKDMIQLNPKVKVIMCTAMRQKRIVVEAIEAGAKDFIVKPFEETKVVEAIRHVLGNACS
ncbi:MULTISPECIES: response regulator [Bacillus]|jgi:two-component system chemotaxis response regulator CheY|uniref:Two-component response regulator n=1 Tax=Bacillus licheniformis (strain ATCC 14580 / DSM 13 / JCM 2505 / CCUG 7422 / NBRC 12200 / NCIMB 9375 / NCTC 10341 / NRRL NRS-1264 / Gibson 46) TaxID=279010 RepID=Q65J33_BACLD|nr:MULTISPECIES: response regulator [Bacillus]AAU23569.1 putative two-component response regulator [Bacillus licheniformis DSM 13 = ATCC 14580]AAU40931.1 two-component response regulator YneI [Bacillus licheniformis DSM 13 = ATCC 14580]ARC68029.1 chemotaxis protein CheY [Bacillus licheniformis]ARC73615.1 chemotaxis protein CheY [Bacillus licheniformis]ARW42754.1 Protein CcdB [Bacillus licheniformis]